MKKPIKDLTPSEINRLVAEAQGWEKVEDYSGRMYWSDGNPCSKEDVWCNEYAPLHNWAHTGTLIEKFGIGLDSNCENNRAYYAWLNCGSLIRQKAESQQRAICLAVIASKFGDEVEVSDE